jgi:hypothetical protein
MTALGQQRTCRAEIAMSALPLKADIRLRHRDVSFGPIADSCIAAIFVFVSMASSLFEENLASIVHRGARSYCSATYDCAMHHGEPQGGGQGVPAP